MQDFKLPMNAIVRQLTTQLSSDQEHVFVIPIYQRTYTWGKKIDKLKDFLSIIGNAFDQSDNVGNRFIGFMVTATPENSGTIGRKEFIVVDGQQRITTISLIVCALINRLKKVASNTADDSPAKKQLEDKAESYFRKYIVLDSCNQKQGRLILDNLRFLPSKPDRDDYLRAANGNQPPLNTPIGQAYEEIQKYLNNLEKRLSAIEQFEDRVMGVLRTLTIVLLEIESNKPGEAQSIFESINYRNAPLSPYDLIRNRVFMYQKGTQSDDIFNDIWEPMEKRYSACFNTTNKDESKVPDHERELLLFFHAYLQKDGTKVPKADIYSKFLENIAPESEHKPSKEDVQAYADSSRLYLFFKKSEWATISPQAFGTPFSFYADLNNKQKQQLVRNLQALSFLDIHSTIPFLMGMVSLGATGEELIEASDFYIGLFIRIRFSGTGTQRIGGQISSLTKTLNVDKMTGLRAKGIKKWMYENLLSEKEPAYPSDDSVRSYLTANGVYTDSPTYVKYVLHELCREAQGGGIAKDGPEYLNEHVTIDHVLCQTRSAQWQAYQRRNGDPVDDATFSRHVHLLGNLVLAAKNYEWGNSVYDQPYDEGKMKATDMVNAYHMTTTEIPLRFSQLNQETNIWAPWGYIQIQERNADLIDRILAQWKV